MIKMHFRGDVIKRFHNPEMLCSPVYMGGKLIKNSRGARAKYTGNCTDSNATPPLKRKYVEETNNNEVSAKRRNYHVFCQRVNQREGNFDSILTVMRSSCYKK